MSHIFLSYRRSDTGEEIESIFENLSYFFGDKNIFLDINSIPSGEEFPSFIKTTLKKSKVVLVIIGNSWITKSDNGFKNKLYDKNDFVRMELEVSIKENIPIIPVFINNSKMPDKFKIPSEIRSFYYINGHSLSKYREIDADFKDLVFLIRNKHRVPYANHFTRNMDYISCKYNEIAKIKIVSYIALATFVTFTGEVAYYNNIKETASIKYSLFSNKDIKGELKGEDFISFFYKNIKFMDTAESYALLSRKAQNKLPIYDYENWWNKTVLSVDLNDLKKISDNKFIVRLYYKKLSGEIQCSEDVIELARIDNRWFLNDFIWGECQE